MKIASTVSRYFLGIIFLVFGLNKFLNFIPMDPSAMPEAAQAFMGGLAQGIYFFPLLAITEIAVGGLFLINKYVPLAAVILAPISLNILLFHAVLEPNVISGLVMAILIIVAQVLLMLGHKASYQPLLKA